MKKIEIDFFDLNFFQMPTFQMLQLFSFFIKLFVFFIKLFFSREEHNEPTEPSPFGIFHVQNPFRNIRPDRPKYSGALRSPGPHDIRPPVESYVQPVVSHRIFTVESASSEVVRKNARMANHARLRIGI